MSQETHLIKISKEYPGLWLGQEVTVPRGASTEDKIQAWIKAHDEMNQAYQRLTNMPMTDFNTGQPAASDLLNPHEGVRLQKLIDECNTPDELDKLYDIAVRHGLSPTWDTKLRSLQNQ